MQSGVRQVLVVCGLLGAVVGLCYPALQDAVELAQVHAGVVDTTHPMSPLAMRLWSLQVQIPALLLHWGASERAVSAFLSAAMGALSFQALGLTVFVAGRRTAIACLAPCVIVAFGLARGGITYPVILLGTVYTWGAIGLSLNLLTIALLSAGSIRLGALLLALLPAVHAGLGVTTWALLAVIALARPALRSDLWAAKRWLLLGALISAASFCVHAWRAPAAPAAPATDEAMAASFFEAVLSSWDFHRQLLPVRSIVVAAVIGTAGVSALILWRGWLTSRAALLPLFVLVTAVLGASLHIAQALPGSLPDWISVLMPGRLVNFALLSGAALAIGLATRDVVLRSRRLQLAAVALLSIISVVYVTRAAVSAPARWAAAMAVASNDAFFARVAEGRSGVLTASDIPDVQRRTRRPVVLNGAWIDTILYAPESGAAINRALIAIYGVDLLRPPADSLDGIGTLPGDTARALWEGRSADEWRELGRAWNFDQIVIYGDWQLQLPRVAAGHGLALYAVPY